MKKFIKLFNLLLVVFTMLFLVACGGEKEPENKYGNELYVVENYDRTLVTNFDYGVGTNYFWTYEISLDKVVNITSEEYVSLSSPGNTGGSGKYNAKFEADIDLENDREIVITYTYNTPDKQVKHPKTYELTVYVTYDGLLEVRDFVSRNLNGPDEAEHVWIHHDAVKVTCENDGWTEYDECSICGEIRGREYFEKFGGTHDFELTSKNTEIKKECCIHEEYTCKKCGVTKGTYDNALGRKESDMDNLNVLLIGNSYTNYNTLMNCLKGVITGEGIKVNITKVSYGSQYLYDYVEGPKGDYYYKVDEATRKEKFDIVFLQDQSSNPAADPANFFEYARKLYDYFTKFGSTCIMYQTWTRKGGNSSKGWTEFEMAQRLAASYEAIGEELGIRVSRAGTAFYYMMTEHPEFVMHNSDNSHPSPFGTYIVALCHYATLYGRSPIGINYTYNDYLKDTSITWHASNERKEITAQEQKILEEVAYKAVFGPSMVTDEFKVDSKNYKAN